jgi:hypothetical protein
MKKKLKANSGRRQHREIVLVSVCLCVLKAFFKKINFFIYFKLIFF